MGGGLERITLDLPSFFYSALFFYLIDIWVMASPLLLKWAFAGAAEAAGRGVLEDDLVALMQPWLIEVI